MINFDNTKRVWTFYKTGYTVELANWRIRVEGEEKWNIYVYFHPSHQWYKDHADKVNNMHDVYEVDHPPLHGGVTYFRKDVSVCIGCDYAHCGDERYSTETRPEYFRHDLEEVIEWCDSYGKDALTEEVKPVQPIINSGASKAFSLEDMYDALNLHEGVLD